MSEAPITPEILEVILRTSRVKGCKEVYSLAPRGHRVGVYFQQRRAILLAAAIRSRLGKAQLEQQSVAIIGGGASGTTFLLSLHAEGASDIRLYEASDKLLARGNSASHRLLHPNYNRWPLLGSMDVFTSLPMLNWYATSADRVSKMMNRELDGKHEPILTNHVSFGHKIKKIIQKGPKNAKRLELTIDVSGSEIFEEHDIVVIAAGFGTEGAATWGLNDYWNEGAEVFDELTHRRPCRIYGTGDGALIDMVRACAKSPAEAWRIPLEMIARIRSEDATTLPRDNVENFAPRYLDFTRMERTIQAHEESIRGIAWSVSRGNQTVADAYAAEEETFYIDCIRELRRQKRHTLDEIEKLLKPAATSDDLLPLMIGIRGNGFEPTSAPINKLLLALLLETKRVRYKKKSRKITHGELDAWAKASEIERTKKIVVCRTGATRNFPMPASIGSRLFEGVIVELEGHGPLHETETEAQLIDALSSITGGEYIYFDAMPDPFTRARYGLNKEGATREMRFENRRILEDFAKEYLRGAEVALKPQRGGPNEGSGSKWVVFTPLSNEEVTSRLVRLGGMDGNFLGAPIVLGNEANMIPGPF